MREQVLSEVESYGVKLDSCAVQLFKELLRVIGLDCVGILLFYHALEIYTKYKVKTNYLLTSIALNTSTDAISVLLVNTEIMVRVATSEVNSGQDQHLVALSTVFVLKVNGCGLHGDGLELRVHDLIPDFFYFALLLLDRLGLRLQFAHHELFDDTEFKFLFLL